MAPRLLTAISVLLVLLAPSTVLPQTVGRAPARSVVEQYQRGVKAVEVGDWDTAIEALTKAVAADQTARLYGEGAFRNLEYFPQFYLAVAYARKGDREAGRRMLETAGPVPRTIARQYQAVVDGLAERVAVAPIPAPLPKVVQAEPEPAPPVKPDTPPVVITEPTHEATTETPVALGPTVPPSQPPSPIATTVRSEPKKAPPPVTVVMPQPPTALVSDGGMVAPPAPDDPARDGLLALFNGRTQEAAILIDRALYASSASNEIRARLSAYLGVAYVYLSIESPASRRENEALARRYFRQARTLDPRFVLSSRLVAPPARRLFDDEGRRRYPTVELLIAGLLSALTCMGLRRGIGRSGGVAVA